MWTVRRSIATRPVIEPRSIGTKRSRSPLVTGGMVLVVGSKRKPPSSNRLRASNFGLARTHGCFDDGVNDRLKIYSVAVDAPDHSIWPGVPAAVADTVGGV